MLKPVESIGFPRRPPDVRSIGGTAKGFVRTPLQLKSGRRNRGIFGSSYSLRVNPRASAGPSTCTALPTCPVTIPAMKRRLLLAGLACLLIGLPAYADEPQEDDRSKLQATQSDSNAKDRDHANTEYGPEVFGEGVRPTPWLTPQQEQQSFRIHPDYEVRLFASEPQIAKPLNMAPDSQGRLWVTCTREYPYPAESSETARDFIMVLSDKDGDGRADQFKRFADQLNIPMGVLPYGDGCICFSIPNLLYLRDTDGDGVCDQRTKILGPFDTTRDTHGMINALRDGGDGWIYACHGFNNQSAVAGKDGEVVRMTSGNTFRFRPDGSRVELYTQGQVNPFGMTEDEWGYRYSADCHSKPITQLIYGACYPSFGRPHDGLGFLPSMMDHLHGSTAISGIQYIPPDSSMVALRGQFISGNVMTSRINRNRLIFTGATAKAEPMEDFLSSNDPWFRPVDIRLGSDGFIYVADFYNRIIGHYEVPLDHPGRDRTSGRIWQIRAKKTNSESSVPKATVTNALNPGDPPDGHVIDAARRLRDFERLEEIDFRVLFADDSPRHRLHALRLVPEVANPTPNTINLVRKSLTDPNPHVRRAAAESLGRIGTTKDVPVILEALARVPSNDPVMRQSHRIAIRNLLRDAGTNDAVWTADVTPELASILLGLPNHQSAGVLLRFLRQSPNCEDRDVLLAHATQHAGASQLPEAVNVARAMTSGNMEQAYEMLETVCEAQNVRPGSAPTSIRNWASELVGQSLSAIDPLQPLINWSGGDGNWPEEVRNTTGDGEQRLTSSFGRGESYTGRLKSDAFRAPKHIQFYLAGHNGFPDKKDHGKNRIQLLDHRTGQVLAEATPPRNDRAQRIDWDTSKYSDRWVRIECVDGDSAGAYAWLAFGRFEPSWLDPSPTASKLQRALSWIERLGLKRLNESLNSMLQDARFSAIVRVRIAETVAKLSGDPTEAVVYATMRNSGSPIESLERAINVFASSDHREQDEIIQQLCKRFTAVDQREFVLTWIAAGASVDYLVKIVESGWISPMTLADPDVAQAMQPRLSTSQKETIRQLTSDLDLDASQTQKLVQLRQQVNLDHADINRGKQLYTQHCAACHQLRGEGAVVGPQLDGAATRSVARLLEDVITPDRNVDRAFRTTSFLLDDGRVQVGLVTNETDRDITLVESNGKSVRFDKSSIERRKEAGRSLMPSNLAEVLKPEDLADLFKYIRG